MRVDVRCIRALVAVLFLATAFAQESLDASLLDRSVDVGDVGAVGSVQREGDSIVIMGSGEDIYHDEDAFHFLYAQVTGDFAITAKVTEFDAADVWGKAGLHVRSSLDADSDNTSLIVTGGGRVATMRRDFIGGSTSSTSRQPITSYRWLRIVRTGNRIDTYYRRDGERWRFQNTVEHLFPSEVYVGLAVTSHQKGILARAVFEGVDLTGDVANLEMDVEAALPMRLHVTDEELEIWRRRAEDGPYRTEGDVSPNSPGDWERIVANAETFQDAPGRGRWRGQTEDRCFKRSQPAPDHRYATRIRDAAFYALVVDDANLRGVVRDELIAVSREAGTDFSNVMRWCEGALRDLNPGFEIANWYTKLLFAYDYVGSEAFSSEDRSRLDRWFEDSAFFFEQELHIDVDRLFVDRRNGDYRLTDEGRQRNETCPDISHYDGWNICALAMFYNNRRATFARYAGLVGIKVDVPVLRERSKRFFEEWLRFSMYPDGVVGDFHRWSPSHPDLGWNYGAVVLGSMVTLADHLARAGDRELYDLATSEGQFGTASPEDAPKNLLLGIQNLQSYLTPEVKRYATTDPSLVGQERVRIDGEHAPINWDSEIDVIVVPANLYYRDEGVRAIYTREAPGVEGYPARLASNGVHVPWTGDWGIYPGVLFMYGQLEGMVDPYP